MNGALQVADLQSSILARAQYNAARAWLLLEFRDGSRYCYSGVPDPLFTRLVQAPSKGAFFNHQIRNRYPYARIETGEN
jgi:lysyl-tRNA synthetase class 2